MTITEEKIIEIAELLECGMICFFHHTTGNIEYYPDPDSLYFDPEPWQDIMDKIERDWHNYKKFEKMNSNEGYRVMENFTYSLADTNFQNKILAQLNRRKPFQNFKYLVESSNFRQQWFDFRKNAYIDFVKRQIKH